MGQHCDEHATVLEGRGVERPCRRRGGRGVPPFGHRSVDFVLVLVIDDEFIPVLGKIAGHGKPCIPQAYVANGLDFARRHDVVGSVNRIDDDLTLEWYDFSG